MMPRRRIRFNERALFAILLLEFGIILPLLSAFSAPRVGPARAEVRLDASLAARLSRTDDHTATIYRAPTTGEEIATATSQPVQASDRPVAALAEPTATLPQSLDAAALLAPTLTNTPEALPAVPGPADAAARPLPTLLPTLVAPAPAVAPADTAEGGPPPILMYHYVRYVDAESDPLGYDLSIAPELFEAQMAWLHEQGYTTMRMDAVARCVRGEGRCPAKAVALTFDDGYADAFTGALPVLQRYGFTATFYIISGLVGQPGYMSWEQIGALRDAGMEIGAHTVDHPDLVNLDLAESERQIVQSKADLEHNLGVSVVSFCYPTGLYNATIEEQTRAAGYLSATTTRWDGDYSDIMALPRRRVAGGTGVDGFAAIVQGY